jgi:hypothetical protein
MCCLDNWLKERTTGCAIKMLRTTSRAFEMEDHHMNRIETLRERVDALENHVRRLEHPLRWRRGIVCSLLAGLAALVLFFPGLASAGIDPASYQHVDINHPYPAQYADAGGYVSCPVGTKAVASGVTSSGLRDFLTTGITTFDGNGAFATARGIAGGYLQISVRCVDAAQVQSSILRTKSIRDHRGGYYHSGRVDCPQGTVAYGGGGFFSRPGGQPFGNATVYASMPVGDGTGWVFAAAGGLLFNDTELWVSAHCLPRGQFGQIVTVTETDTAPEGTNYPTLSATARCPFGFAYAGGAWLHPGDSSAPQWVGYLTVSNMTADDKGWFARAWTFGIGAKLTATVQCMTLVID